MTIDRNLPDEDVAAPSFPVIGAGDDVHLRIGSWNRMGGVGF